MKHLLTALLLLTALVGCGDSDYSSGGETTSNATSSNSTSNGTASNATSNGTASNATSNGTSNGTIREPLKHRPDEVACDDFRSSEPVEGDFIEGECERHEDCQDGANGRCVINRDFAMCTYDQCFADADCGDSVCRCGDDQGYGPNVCLNVGNCLVDSDCGDGGYCSPTFGECGDYSGVIGFYCHTAEDACIDDADCGGGSNYCAFNPSVGRWMCSDSHCAG